MSRHDVPKFLDERREWLRIDDKLLLDYRVVGKETAFGPPNVAQATHEAITTFITKPTEDLLKQPHGHEAEALLIPWLKKIDWVLEVLLQQLAKGCSDVMPLPRLTDVAISGGGISFDVSQVLREGDYLDLRLILPPFVPIAARAVVTRVESAQRAESLSTVATRFVNMNQDDHERLIRHIFHLQAEHLRTRHLNVATVHD